MQKRTDQNRFHIPDWLWITVLVVLLFLMYFSVFTSDYLMNDELDEIGSLRLIGARVIDTYFRMGRGLFSIPVGLLYNFAGFDPSGSRWFASLILPPMFYWQWCCSGF